MSRSIYVAGGSDERREAQAAIDTLKAAGWHVTHEWPKDPGYPENGGQSDAKKSAMLDFDAVTRAEVVWIRCPQEKSEGAAVELGIALTCRFYGVGVRGRCIIVSGVWKHRIFAHCADVQFSTHEQAMAWLLESAP